jgi:hypothetical protein
VVPTSETLSSAVVATARNRLRSQLGPVWGEIERRDRNAKLANPTQPRHLLAVLDERAGICERDLAEGHRSRVIPDTLGLMTVVTVLERSASDPRISALLPDLVTQEGFRHNILTLGFADLARRAGRSISIPLQSAKGVRMYDLDLGDPGNSGIAVETKTSDEFDGFVRVPTVEECENAVRRAWEKDRKLRQLPRTRAGLILLGGVTLGVRGVPTIVHVAEHFLWKVGQRRPRLVGIAIMTFWTATTDYREEVAGNSVRVSGSLHGSVYLELAANPHYSGKIPLSIEPGDKDWILDQLFTDRGHPRL